jgi:hypothetical protein
MHGAALIWTALLNGLLYAAIFYAVGWVGSFLINFIWITPTVMYADQVETIAGLNVQVASRSVSAQEQDNRKTVRKLVANATDDERAVLNALSDHNELLGQQLYEIGNRAAIDSALGKWRHKLIHEHVDPSNKTYWSIVPGLKEALVYVLHEDPKA